MNIAEISATIEAAKKIITEQREKIERYEAAFLQIHGELGAAIIQRAASDDRIIAEHIEKADKIALDALHGPRVSAAIASNEALLRFVMFGERPR